MHGISFEYGFFLSFEAIIISFESVKISRLFVICKSVVSAKKNCCFFTEKPCKYGGAVGVDPEVKSQCLQVNREN